MNSSYLEDVTGLAQGSSKMVKVRCQSNASPDCVLEVKDNIREFVKALKEMVIYFVQKVFGQYLIQKKNTKYPKVTVECNSKISEGCSINTTISYRFLTKPS